MVEIISEEKPLLDGLGINQQFDWYDLNDPTSHAQAYIDIGAITNDEGRASTAWVDIKEFHVSVENSAEVPEPSSLLLLCLGALTLIIKRGRSR